VKEIALSSSVANDGYAPVDTSRGPWASVADPVMGEPGGRPN